MSRFRNVAHRLYAGDISYDFIGRRRLWYALSGLVLVLSIVSLLVRGLTLSIDFKGGALFEVQAAGHSVSDATAALDRVGLGGDKSTVQTVGSGSDTKIRITTPILDEQQTKKVESALTTTLGVDEKALNPQQVGATWGSEITKKALEGLVVFLLAVVAYLGLRFDVKMSGAAIVALLHDLLITAGLYSLVGFEVSPETVVALLTILGYSLYDTVVVFDKVRENTAGIGPQSRLTFSEAANLAVNQTLVRSINTSIIALLPVAGLLFIGVYLLGAGTLKDLSLALLIGLATGAYSSIFIATPLVCEFREREPAMRQLSRKVAQRRTAEAKAAELEAAQGVAAVPLGMVAGAVAGAGAGAAGGGGVNLTKGSGDGDLEADDGRDDADSTGPADAVVAGRTPGARPAPGARPQQQQQRRRPSGRPSGAKKRR